MNKFNSLNRKPKPSKGVLQKGPSKFFVGSSNHIYKNQVVKFITVGVLADQACNKFRNDITISRP